MSVQKVLLSPFYCQPRPSGVSLESPGLQNILQFPGNRAAVDQNHDARKAVSATVSVLKSSGAIFRPTSSKVSVQNVLLCPFDCKKRPSGVPHRTRDWKISRKFRRKEPKLVKITLRVRRSRLLFQA